LELITDKSDNVFVQILLCYWKANVVQGGNGYGGGVFSHLVTVFLVLDFGRLYIIYYSTLEAAGFGFWVLCHVIFIWLIEFEWH
jgi:hypothetical protein